VSEQATAVACIAHIIGQGSGDNDAVQIKRGNL